MKLSMWFDRVRGRFPVRLPYNEATFEQFFQNICRTYGLADESDHRYAVASIIQHLGADVGFKAPYFFARAVYKMQANQIAFKTIQRLAEEQKQKAKEAEAAKAVAETNNGEATPVTTGLHSVPVSN